MGMQLCAWCIVSYSNVNCNYRKAKLPVEMELEATSSSMIEVKWLKMIFQCWRRK